MTVQVDASPEARLVGVHETGFRTVGATSAIEAVCELPLYVAVMTAFWAVEMVPAVAANVALLEPAATVTEAGTLSVEWLLARATFAPPAAAA